MKKKPVMEREERASALARMILAVLALCFAPGVLAEDRAGAGIGGGSGGSASRIVINGGVVDSFGGGVGEVTLQMVRDIVSEAAEAARAAAFDDVYPVGSIYVSTNASTVSALPACFTQGGRKWERIASDRCLWNTSDGGGGDLAGSLPRIVGSQSSDRGFVFQGNYWQQGDPWGGCLGALSSGATPHHWNYENATGGWVGGYSGVNINFDASRCSGVYSASAGSDVVRPTSVAVCMWKRTE